MQKRSQKFRDYFLKDINPVIRFLILSDVVVVGAAALFGPIFAIFIEDFIVGGNAEVAGIATGVYLFSKSILQIPMAYLLDKIKGEKDDFWFMFIFTMLMSLLPLFYLVIRTPIQLYIIQFALGLFTAFTFPSFMAIFTRHIDKSKESTEWGVYFTLTDIASALFAVIGGFVAMSEGFPVLIITVVFISLIGSLLLLPIRPYIKLKT